MSFPFSALTLAPSGVDRWFRFCSVRHVAKILFSNGFCAWLLVENLAGLNVWICRVFVVTLLYPFVVTAWKMLTLRYELI